MKQLQSNINVLRTPTNPRNNFTMVPNEVIFNKDLSAKTRFLLIFMLALPEGWNFNERGLSTATGEGRTMIRNALKELEDKKYLYRLQTRNASGTGFGHMIYYLFTAPTNIQIEGQESSQEETLTGVYVIDKSNPDYAYLSGGWMLED